MIQYLSVAHGLADAHVQRNLADPGHRHDTLVAELLFELANHGIAIKFLQSGHCYIPLLNVHNFFVGLENSHLAAILKVLEPYPVTLLGDRVVKHHV